ncbi:transaldolase family protein [Treponema sp. TIM-1]|uniref:transaldolase family protein n=1 Tax=Treponema sp. TIM-1 TaxID=2898417 RepID=UPI0039809D0C
MKYLEWLSSKTQTKWWHDSAIPSEIDEAIQLGAMGVTTNPILTFKALEADPAYWAPELAKIPGNIVGTPRVEALLKVIALAAAGKFRAIFDETKARHGYALAQVNPSYAGNTKEMLEQGLRYASWAENIAVKVPTTKAALPVIEELAAKGIAVCTTLNFSVSQAIAASQAYERGLKRAKKNGIPLRPCFIVQQGGRLDEYLMDVIEDNGVSIEKENGLWAGNAVCRRSYRILQEQGSSALIMPAGLRGSHHLSVMAGAKMVFSLQARMQHLVNSEDLPQEEHINEEIDEKIIKDLLKVNEFERAYKIEGQRPGDFITFGVMQRTLSQFLWTGWVPLETYGTTEKSQRWF